MRRQRCILAGALARVAGDSSARLPQVGSEVVVDFLDGDPDRPIIIGRVYNGDDVPPIRPGR